MKKYIEPEKIIMKPSNIVKKLPKIILSVKKIGVKRYFNIYVRYKETCIELSDYPDFRVLMYIPYSEIEKIEFEENEQI